MTLLSVQQFMQEKHQSRNRDDEQKNGLGANFKLPKKCKLNSLTHVLVISPTQAQRAFHDFIF